QSVILGPLRIARTPPHAGGVDEAIPRSADLGDGVHRVPGGARDVVNDRPFVSDETVEERRLPDVGASGDRDGTLGAPARFSLQTFHVRDDDVEQVACAAAM